MDHMNSDNQFDVPDTPDRLVHKDLKERSFISLEGDLSTSGHSGCANVAGEQNGNRHNVNGVLRKTHIRPPRRILVKPEFHGDSSASRTSRNGVPVKVPSIHNSKEKHNLHLSKSENTDLKTQISCQLNCPIVDLKKQSGSKYGFVEGEVENWETRSAAMNELSHSDRMPSFIPSSSASKGKETDDLSKVGSSFKFRGEKDSAIDEQHGARKDGPASLGNSRGVLGQKRLVRNGCISPENIAKAKKQTVKEDNGVLIHGLTSTSLPASYAGTSSDCAKELISKNGISSSAKGKGVAIHSSPSKEREATHPSNRSLISTDEKAKETGHCDSVGWRSTRNRNQNMNLSLQNEHWTSEKDACFVTHSTGSRVMRRDVPPLGQDSASIGSVSGESLGPQRRQINGHRTPLNTVKKRLKQGPVSSSNGECSTSVSDDIDTISLASSESRISARSTRNPNHVGTAIEPVIVVDSPSSHVVCSSSRDEDARARQLEADERLARELQEQLYNEMPSSGIGEIDEDVALALVQEDHASSRGDNQLSSLNGSLVSNFCRRQSRNASRRVPQPRASTSNRMARLRNRFPGQPRTISSSRGRNSIFPPDVDVDMRMHILETLEAFSNMDVDGNLLQTQRDFNENDYEMLLALDENNHRHGGASARQINGLPESTVQAENLEEACAICLDVPTMGNVIRHLPCLHKFHKDCIDPWLRRRTSCPVCKCSVT